VNYEWFVRILIVGVCLKMVLVVMMTERPNCDSHVLPFVHGAGRFQEFVLD